MQPKKFATEPSLTDKKLIPNDLTIDIKHDNSNKNSLKNSSLKEFLKKKSSKPKKKTNRQQFDELGIILNSSALWPKEFIKKSNEELSGESGINNGKITTKNLRRKIIKDLLQPNYIKDVIDTISNRYWYRKIAEYMFLISNILIFLNIIFSYLSAVYELKILSLIGGTCGVAGVSLMRIENSFKNRSKNATSKLNIILEELDIDNIPDINFEENEITSKDESNEDNVVKSPQENKNIEFIENTK